MSREQISLGGLKDDVVKLQQQYDTLAKQFQAASNEIGSLRQELNELKKTKK